MRFRTITSNYDAMTYDDTTPCDTPAVTAGECQNPLPAAPAPLSPAPSEAPAKQAISKSGSRRPGAKPGNSHALKTGFASPKCPPGARGIDARRYAFRRRACADYRARHGLAADQPLPLYVEARIDTATRHHKCALLAEWLVRTTTPEKPDAAAAAATQALLDKAADFSDRRDKALREIGLDTAADETADDPMAKLSKLVAGGAAKTPPVAFPTDSSSPQTGLYGSVVNPASETPPRAPEKLRNEIGESEAAA